MPTKPNRAGQPQNYVPAGYGDASGEYGDNATGSNIHFKSFAKPKEETKDNIEIKQTGDNPVDLKPKKTIEDLNEAIKKTMGKLTPNSKKLIKNIGESNADPRYISLMANLYESGNYKFDLGKNNKSYFQSLINEVSLGKESLDGTEEYEKGTVFFHESGHALDYTYKNGENKKIFSSYIDKINYSREQLWSLKYKSQKYGMTLQESVADELSRFKETSEVIKLANEIKQDFVKENQKVEEINKELLELRNQTQKIDAQNNKKVAEMLIDKYGYDQESLSDNYLAGLMSDVEYYQTRKSLLKDVILFRDKLEKELPLEQQKVQERKNRLYNERQVIMNKINNDSFKKYGDLSDMVQAISGIKVRGGHEDGYFDNDNGRHQATECFAEITSAKAVNKESYNILKQYIPRTLEIYEEIIGEIENGR